MTSPFIAEIRIFGFNFPPRGWALCNGQILPIQQNTALFSLLGTTYGGNGTSNFALPNFQGRAPMHAGPGPGLTPRVLGELAGVPTVTLLTTELPGHTHPITGAAIPSSTPTGTPSSNSLFTNSAPNALYATTVANVNLAPQSVSIVGGGQPHNNMQPYLTLNFCIALQGIFPARN